MICCTILYYTILYYTILYYTILCDGHERAARLVRQALGDDLIYYK